MCVIQNPAALGGKGDKNQTVCFVYIWTGADGIEFVFLATHC